MTALATVPAPTRPAMPAPVDVLDLLAQVSTSPIPASGVQTVMDRWGLSRWLAVQAIRYAVAAMPDTPTSREWARLMRIGQARVNGIPVTGDPDEVADQVDWAVEAYPWRNR